jgi:hypothetical protein
MKRLTWIAMVCVCFLATPEVFGQQDPGQEANDLRQLWRQIEVLETDWHVVDNGLATARGAVGAKENAARTARATVTVKKNAVTALKSQEAAEAGKVSGLKKMADDAAAVYANAVAETARLKGIAAALKTDYDRAIAAKLTAKAAGDAAEEAKQQAIEDDLDPKWHKATSDAKAQEGREPGLLTAANNAMRSYSDQVALVSTFPSKIAAAEVEVSVAEAEVGKADAEVSAAKTALTGAEAAFEAASNILSEKRLSYFDRVQYRAAAADAKEARRLAGEAKAEAAKATAAATAAKASADTAVAKVDTAIASLEDVKKLAVTLRRQQKVLNETQSDTLVKISQLEANQVTPEQLEKLKLTLLNAVQKREQLYRKVQRPVGPYTSVIEYVPVNN